MTLQDTELGESSGTASDEGADPRKLQARAWSGHLTGLRPLLLRLHFYAGLLVSPFVLIAAVTGLLYTVSPQLEQGVHAHELTVAVGAERIPLAEQVSIAQQALPEGTLTEIHPAPEPDSTTHMGVLFGVVNQLLLVALALALICMVVLGLPDVVAAQAHSGRPGHDAGIGYPTESRGSAHRRTPGADRWRVTSGARDLGARIPAT